ncbi:hypothetical protein L210DRAFT_114152 [Boletus edulis BED1]|uniref:Uncharacterized protein n=1 Tax=Boletus edulis BED1 TaxID=1328754 RepID=A0AAD4BQN9_BOLED|nr:hypothetical protein L210DRAFT_114152 [Boletus edulis BED1]
MVSHRAVVCHVSLGLILGNHHHRHWCLLIFHGDGAQSSSPTALSQGASLVLGHFKSTLLLGSSASPPRTGSFTEI